MGLSVTPAGAPVSHMCSCRWLCCVCLQMANLVTSLCCVVLAAVVVAYAQRRSQLGEYAFFSSSLMCSPKHWKAFETLLPLNTAVHSDPLSSFISTLISSSVLQQFWCYCALFIPSSLCPLPLLLLLIRGIFHVMYYIAAFTLAAFRYFFIFW